MKQILHNFKSNSSYQIRVLLVTGLFSLFTNFAAAQNIFESFAILNINGTGTAYYNMEASLPFFTDLNGANLGTFTKGTNTIVFSGGQNNTTPSSCGFTSSAIKYRVYLTGFPSGLYTSINEPLTGPGSPNETWEQTTGTAELIASLPPGAYTLEVFSEAVYTGCGGGIDLSDNGGLNYKAVFTVVNPQTAWNGSAWSNSAPTSLVEAVIDGTYSTSVNGVITANRLTINSGKSLTVNTGTNITVQNEVINNGSLVLENNANLIQVNITNNSGEITVNRNSNPLFREDYTMWSSPVTGSQTLLNFSPSTLATRFYTYDNTLVANGLYTAVGSPSTVTFTAGTGYLIRMPNTDPTTNYDAGTTTLAYPGVFTGTPNNGTVTLGSVTPLISDKFYAVGNPYPSTIGAQLFLDGNSTDGVLYFWRKTNAALGTAYATFTTGGATTTTPTSAAPDGTIAVGQGFIVKTGVAATTLSFTNTMRTGNNTAQFFKTKQLAQKDRVWLNLTSATGVFSQALVAYIADATTGIDIYDGKYINDSPIALTSSISNEEYTIQGRPAFDAMDVVTLNVKTDVAGDYTIAIDHVDGLFSGSQDIYLVDSKTGIETNLKTTSYLFTAAAAVDNSRFSLKFQKTLSLDVQVFNDNSVIVYKNNGVIYVNSCAKMMNNIKVFDIQGRLIAERNNVKANTTSIQNLRASNQILIVKVTTDDNLEISKKVEN